MRCVSRRTLKTNEDVIRKLGEQMPSLREVSDVCDFILLSIASRAHTDITAALEKLQDLSGTQVVVISRHLDAGMRTG